MFVSIRASPSFVGVGTHYVRKFGLLHDLERYRILHILRIVAASMSVFDERIVYIYI